MNFAFTYRRPRHPTSTPFKAQGAVVSLETLLELAGWSIDLTEEGERVVVAEIEKLLTEVKATVTQVRTYVYSGTLQ